MNWHDIVNDPGSTTQAFKFLSSDYRLEVLFSDFEQEVFKRIIVIKLDNIPVMVASSETHISNAIFLDILQNSQTTPIGVRLFDPKSGIKRGSMFVKQIDLAEVEDPIVVKYISTLINNEELYFRTSTFRADKQTMNLKEYVLPGLKLIVNRYKEKG